MCRVCVGIAHQHGTMSMIAEYVSRCPEYVSGMCRDSSSARDGVNDCRVCVGMSGVCVGYVSG